MDKENIQIQERWNGKYRITHWDTL